MSKILYTIALAAIAVACTGKSPKDNTADPHAGHNHAQSVSVCGVAGSNHQHEEPATAKAKTSSKAEPEPEETHSDEIFFSLEQAAMTDFKVEQVVSEPFSEITKCSGQILAAQGDQRTITANVGGIVTLSDTRMSEGSAVGKGQRMFYISSKNIASGDLMARSEAAYIKAKADLARAEKLLADKIVSQKEYDQLKLTYEQARTEYEPLENARTTGGTAVSSPIAGYVTSLNVAHGQYVEIGAPLAVVSQNRRLQLRADVSQRYYNRLASVVSASFITPSSDEAFDLRTMGGRLISTGVAAQSGGGMIPVTFEFDNRSGVVPGSFVEVFLIGAPVPDAITLPLTAITEQQGLYYVYVQMDEEGYKQREVTLGANDGSRVRILTGLTPGENVVTRGAINIKLAASSGTIPSSHQH